MRRYSAAISAGALPIILIRRRRTEHNDVPYGSSCYVTRVMQARGITQAAAKLLGVTQPRVSDLMRGKIERFSIDTLIAMLAQAGVGVTVKVRRGKHAA